MHDKVLLSSGVIVEMKIWDVTEDERYPDRYKYSLFAVYDGDILVGYDNHHPKGHHRHIDSKEEHYNFRSLENLKNDFKSDIEIQIAKERLVMKTKKITIQIKSLDDALDDFTNLAEKIHSGEKVKPQPKGIYLADVETVRAIFTEGRMKIVNILKEKEPKSIYALAKILKRDFKNVHDDVSFLAQLGILTLKESKTGRKQKKPSLVCDKILFEMAA